MSMRIRSPTSKGRDNNSLSPSWADQVTLSECRSHNTSGEDSASPDANTSANNISNSSNISQDRQITVEFIDDVNEEKYKRLVQEEKIKTPFKRRHELDSPANSPNTSNSDGNSENNDYKVEKRLRHNSQTSSTSSNNYIEKDPAVISRRQKQIDYGKNTVAYERYLEAVPRSERTRDHPNTPNKYGKYSRRAFDGLIKIWRKQLHHYDPPNKDKQLTANDSSSEESE